MSLTLPIQIGKKYVRRDGGVVKIDRHDMTGWVGDGNKTWKIDSGSWSPNHTGSMSDLVADYIEPAKGHPHAALMAQFAQDAAESETPWDRWEYSGPNAVWHPVERCAPTWESWLQYRRKPVITPDPHAESMKLYAEDAAETDKAWTRWECRNIYRDWDGMTDHPRWESGSQYRRKASA